MPFLFTRETGWGGTPIKRKRPLYARDYIYEIRFPGRDERIIDEMIEQIRRNVTCMIKRRTLIPRLQIGDFTVFVKTMDDLLAVRMATTVTDVAIYRLHTPVPRQPRAAVSVPLTRASTAP